MPKRALRVQKKTLARRERPFEISPRLGRLPILRRCYLFRRFMGDESDTDFPACDITCSVAKIKNASSKPKPFRTIIERPIAAWFWQEVHKSTNQIVDTPFIVCGGTGLLGQNLSGLDLPHIHEVNLL